MTRHFGIDYIAQSYSQRDEKGRHLPFGKEFPVEWGVGKLVDGHYPFFVRDKPQISVNPERNEAIIINTRGYDGIYLLRKAVERFQNIANNGWLNKVVAITAEKDSIPFEIVCTSEIFGDREDYFIERIYPATERKIM